MIKTTLMFSFHWKTLVPFCLPKKRPESVFLILIVNYAIQKNKLCYPKQQLTDYLMIYDTIYVLLAFIGKLAFFNKLL